MYIRSEYMNDTKLTSVKIISELYNKFKIEAMKKEFTLQKLVNRSIDLYVEDGDFRNKIHRRIIENRNRF